MRRFKITQMVWDMFALVVGAVVGLYAAGALAVNYGSPQTSLPISANATPITSTVNDLFVVGPTTSQLQDESYATAPVYASGGCSTTPVIAGSPYAFTYTQGASGCSGSTLVLTLPTAGNNGKWICDAHDITSPTTTVVEQSAAASATSVQLTNYTRTTGAVLTWVANDVILVRCTS